jgi:hypothetical protein
MAFSIYVQVDFMRPDEKDFRQRQEELVSFFYSSSETRIQSAGVLAQPPWWKLLMQKAISFSVRILYLRTEIEKSQRNEK